MKEIVFYDIAKKQLIEIHDFLCEDTENQDLY